MSSTSMKIIRNENILLILNVLSLNKQSESIENE